MSELLQEPQQQDEDEKTEFSFAELSPRAQQRAVEWWSGIESAEWSADDELGYAVDCLSLLGITVDTRTAKYANGHTAENPEFNYDLGQGGGLTFSGWWAAAELNLAELTGNVNVNSPLLGYGAQLMAIYLGCPHTRARIRTQYHGRGLPRMEVEIKQWLPEVYVDDGGDEVLALADELKKIFRDCSQWVYQQLQDDLECRTSEESCREYLLADSDRIFYDDGEAI